MPFCSGVSWREPVPTHTPTETERTCGMTSVMTRTPFDKCVNSMSRTVVVEFARVAKKKSSSLFCTTFEVCLASFGCGAARLRRLWPCACFNLEHENAQIAFSLPGDADYRKPRRVLEFHAVAGCRGHPPW